MGTESNLRWLDDSRAQFSQHGVSFGVPWPRGLYRPGQTFAIEGNGEQHPLDARALALWADGSLKWTAHSISGQFGYSQSYAVKPAASIEVQGLSRPGVAVDADPSGLLVRTRHGLCVSFSPPGNPSLLNSLSLNGQNICSGVEIVASVSRRPYSTRVRSVRVENATLSRVVVKISGVVASSEAGEEHLPFDLRVYVYSDAPSIKVVYSFIHDLDAHQPLTSLGLRFSVPFNEAELYNRHVRLGGPSGAVLREEVQGLSGLRHGPKDQDRADQTAGRAVTLTKEGWAKVPLDRALSYIPSWGSYSLAQLSSDGFTIKKRTKRGCSWVKVTGGSRADGTAYIGSARHGGLAVGMSDFWERYPTQLDLTDLTEDTGTVTVWLYSPNAEPLDTSPFHDGLGEDSYQKQLDALDVTYEDYEPGYATANGIARTNQIFLQPFSQTPSNAELGLFSSLVRNPPRLVPTAAHMHAAGVFHGCWAPDFHSLGRAPSNQEQAIERNLDLLFRYYRDQVDQHRWYGFWDHGDVQHTYDPYRHAWRYDVGGYAWDNSELSTDLWLWLYYLHTGRADVFKMAEAMTRHTGEVDVYHAGRFKGFGTRHGVQHFSDSSKQLRISNVLYRRIYYYLTGDERTGDLMSELEECQNALLVLDSHRKVQNHADVPEGFAMTNIGLDCGALAAAWLTAWERRTGRWAGCRDRLVKLLEGISGLEHGIGNNAILLNPTTGEVCECPPPTPEYAISHLSMLFGFPEVFAELLDYARAEHPAAVQGFLRVWLSYCRAYNGGPEVQRREFGFEFPAHATWRQSHSTLTAFAAVEQRSKELASAAWDQFFNTDGYRRDHDWTLIKASPPEYFRNGEEATWVRTNEAARYGISAISNLASIGEYLN